MIKKTLYFGHPARLSLRLGQMVIKLPEVEDNDTLEDEVKHESIVTRPVEDIGLVVLDHRQVTLTQGLLAALLENNVALVTCDSRSMPVGLMMPLEGNTVQNERFRRQIDASLPLRKQLWQQTVRQKILNQAAVLEATTDAETRCMHVWAENVRSGDPDNLEGRAAAYYWRNLFSRTHPGFTRDREGGGPNALLNYGYAILRATMARALVSSGLLPTLGIHHHNRYNAYCLADDMMEAYRPCVDELVTDIVDRYDDISTLTREIKTELLGIPALDVTVDGRRSPLMVAVSATSASLCRCYAGESRRLSLPAC